MCFTQWFWSPFSSFLHYHPIRNKVSKVDERIYDSTTLLRIVLKGYS